MKLTAAMEQEQEVNQNRLQELRQTMHHTDEQETDVQAFIKEIRKHVMIKELDEAVLNRLISEIVVGKVTKVDGKKHQKVKIVYNFVGEIPEMAE